MLTALQALFRSSFREVREGAASGIQLEHQLLGFLQGKECREVAFRARVALPVGCTLSGEVSLESLGPGDRIARPGASVTHTGTMLLML